MARITVHATDHPVPLPDGRTVQTAEVNPEGTSVDGADLFIFRRLQAKELVLAPATVPTDAEQEG